MTMNEMPSGDGAQETPQKTSEPRSQGSETSSSSSKTQRTESEKAKAVADLMRGGPVEPESRPPERDPDGSAAHAAHDPDGAPDGAPEPAPKPRGKPKTMTEAAEMLGMEAKDLYNLELTTGDGKTVKIGALKDIYQNQQAAQQETAKREAALDQRETAFIDDQRLWAEMGDQLKKSLTPAQVEKMRNNLRERELEERRKMFNVMPEMADAAKFDQFRIDIATHLKAYGYKPHEIVVGDHRQLHILRDLIRMKKRLDQLTSFEPKNAPPSVTPTQGRGGKRPVSVNAARNGTEADKISAVTNLIGGRR